MIEFTEEDRRMLRYAAHGVRGDFPGFAESLSELAERPADPDYCPAYQDSYQRLWHRAAVRVKELEAERPAGDAGQPRQKTVREVREALNAGGKKMRDEVERHPPPSDGQRFAIRRFQAACDEALAALADSMEERN